ncbi:MAG: methionine--tRNA ligase [Clostridia bacterium]|nr:methionine--tRNA ligase [Clostridia bacterium]
MTDQKQENAGAPSARRAFYLTTAIMYASRKPHFGNTYEVILADAVARHRRKAGDDVYFLTGTDEHGQKIEGYAREAGVSPKAYVDGVAEEIKGLWRRMNTTESRFIRTTDEDHERVVRRIFERFLRQGDIYKGRYEGWYCTPDESFFTDSQIKDGKCPDCGRPVVRATEEAYFFRMSAYADRLIRYIEDHPDFIEPVSRRNEMLSNFLRPGLQDLCVSRTSFSWGIPVESDPRHVVYVWLDALTNYISAIGYDPDRSYEEQSETFRRLWPADVHFIGKDILRFHTIYWPIFLMALGLPLPKKVFAHPWFIAGEDKMSKSRGNVIYSDDLADLIGADGVRYYALSEMPYGNDGSITYDNVMLRYNTDLANNLGNLVSRTHAMTLKYFGGVIPSAGPEEGTDAELKAAAREAIDAFMRDMDAYRLADACADVFGFLRRANKYIDETTPWLLAKDAARHDRLGAVLYNLLESVRIGAVLLSSVMPATCDAIFRRLGTSAVGYDTLAAFGALESGVSLGEGGALFARLEEKEFAAMIEAQKQKRAPAPSEEKEKEPVAHEAQIHIDDFFRVELRAARVLSAEKIPKAKKLLRLIVDLGDEQRQIVSGIARFYEPEDLVGKTVVVVANLAPATLCGVESRGMLLASGEEQVRVVFLDPSVQPGERIR